MENIEITSGDFLAGGGGVTFAMKQIEGLKCKWVLNHDRIAIRTNMYNNKGIKHYWTDIYKQDERKMEPVNFIWASIECTQHSKAKGGKDKNIGSYTLGWELLRYIQFQMPMVIGIENVPEFKKWAPLDENNKPDKTQIGKEFERWKNTIESLGYIYYEKIMNAADYGIPTRRIRYFAFFIRTDIKITVNWPDQTHNRNGINGLKKWEPCCKHIDLTNEGNSIFGREFNPDIKKGHRKPLSPNTLRRIAGGIRKFKPDMYFIMQYYGTGDNVQSIHKPLNSITSKDRHALIKKEKLQFVQDHCHLDSYNKIDEPLMPQLCRQTKQFVTVEQKNKNFIYNYYGRDNNTHTVENPLGTIVTTQNQKTLISSEIQFISKQYSSNGKPEANNRSIFEPLGAVCTQEKNQFITAYLNKDENKNSKGHLIDSYYTSDFAVHDVDTPLPTIRTTGSMALHSLEANEFDFDIKMRFLTPEELGRISTFPENYFTDKTLNITTKDQVKLIGNAVPPEWARIIIKPVIDSLLEFLKNKN